MEPRDTSRPEGPPAIHGSHLILDARILSSVRWLRPMPWAVLEAVALVAEADGPGLVARTSARHLADLLGVDPGTAAAGLRVLRKRGVLELRRAGGHAGRFGLSAYVLGDVGELGLRPCVGSPGAVAPHVEDPDTQPGLGSRTTTTKPRPNVPARSRASSPSGRPGLQGAFDLGLGDDG